jgi:hypothetical protein
MRELPEGYTTSAPRREDAGAVAALISACQIADTGQTDMSVRESYIIHLKELRPGIDLTVRS